MKFSLLRWLLVLAITLPLLLSTAACNSLVGLNTFASAPPELSIQRVEPIDRSAGIYRVSGRTNLPPDTQISVSAVRYLQPQAKSATALTQTSPVYAILDRQFVPIQQTTWQTELVLWQDTPTGNPQESWQLSQPKAGLTFQPDPTVVFQATVEPANQPKNFKNRIEQLDEPTQVNLVQFTTEGELYLEARTTQAIAPPPTLASAPPAAPVSVVKVEPRPVDDDAVSERKPSLDAPLTSDSFLR